MERIKNYTRYTLIFPLLPHEVTKEIIKDLSMSDLGNLTRVIRSSKIHTEALVIQCAKEFGFKGYNYKGVTKFLNRLYKDLKPFFKNVRFNLEDALRVLPTFSSVELMHIIINNPKIYLKESKPLFDYLINFCINKQSSNGDLALLDIIENRNVLFFAILNGKSDFVKILLKLGVNPNSTTYTGEGALHFAVARNNEKILKHLLDHNVFLETHNSVTNYYTPLCIAAKKGFVNIAKLFLDKGARVEGWASVTPLVIAVFNNDVKMVKFLLD